MIYKATIANSTGVRHVEVKALSLKQAKRKLTESGEIISIYTGINETYKELYNKHKEVI